MVVVDADRDDGGGSGGDQHRAAFATYSAVSVLPVNGTRVSSLVAGNISLRRIRFFRGSLVKLDLLRASP